MQRISQAPFLIKLRKTEAKTGSHENLNNEQHAFSNQEKFEHRRHSKGRT